MASDSYDVLILGGGNAGWRHRADPRLAEGGAHEERDLAHLPDRGCKPKKVLVAAGHALHEINKPMY
jgi:glutathione reductase (NADPH)